MTVPAGRRVAPACYVSSDDALAQLGAVVSELGRRPAVVHGGAGIVQAETFAGPLLPDVPRLAHEGACTLARITTLADGLRAVSADVVVAIGGGKVLDTGKAAANAVGAKVVTVPTSPATCAAMTPLSVIYRDDGVWDHGMALPSCPDGVMVDSGLLERAPRRLFAAGVLDALAKVREVRLALSVAGAVSPSEEAALALCGTLETGLAPAVVEAAFLRTEVEALSFAALAETVIAFPGWIGGFAGEANKLAAAHAVHNAFTHLASSRRALHGELVGFGLVVQALLAENDPDVIVELHGLLGAPRGLSALGCDAYLASDEAGALVDAAIEGAPSFKKAFPNADRDDIRAAVLAADRLLMAGRAKV